MAATWWSVFSALLVSAPLAAQTLPPPAAADRDIVVVGSRAPDLRKRLDDCLAASCKPDRDIAITLDLAQAQFEAGHYEEAQAALLAARHRTARFAREYPVAVANLFHASSVIAAHLGDQGREWSNALDTVSAMKAGMPETDPRVLMERIGLGDAYASAGLFSEAEVQYRAVAGRARKLGLVETEGLALLRYATLNTRLAAQVYAFYGPIARRAIGALLERREPALQPIVACADQLNIQLAALTASDAELDRLIARYPRQPAGAPSVLLHAPPVLMTATGQRRPNGTAADSYALFKEIPPPVFSANLDYMWIDVAYTIGTDGRVHDAHVAARGNRVSGTGDWPEQIVQAIAARRYATQTTPGRGRERFTFTSNMTIKTGSRIPIHSGIPRLVHADLDPDAVTPPPASS
ncbi:hypothetical protein [Sphingomonas sp. TREG-RG-20F-R18-01]|uniref:hypothetical protein n=1 Tax=Sphingomonas sp. TREG-RG-20F-R18-01 TaxID=2914982 RepID=UPI001F57C264|nr:hypothetical protein [Sphingomonas sp. TREG-RG-20F-R18-01]